MLKVWNVSPGRDHLRALHRRHVPHALGHHVVDPHVRRLERRVVVRRLHRDRRRRLERRDHQPQPRSAALAAPHRVARLARGDVPVQQPALRRARVRDPLGRPLPVDLRGARRAPRRDPVAVLRLLRGRVRPPAAPARRHRARRGLAPRVGRGVVQAFRWPFVSALAAGALLRRCSGYASSVAGRRRAQPLPVRRPSRIGLELARGTVARRALVPGTVVAGGADAADRPQPAPLRRLRRAPRGHDRHRRDRRHERVRDQPHASCSRPARRCSSTATASSSRGIESPITRTLHLDRGRDRRLPGRPPRRHAAPLGAHLPRLGRADQADRDPPAAAHRRGSVPRLRRLAAARRRSRSRRSSTRSSTCSGSPPSSSCSASPSPSGPIRVPRLGWRGARTRRSRALVDADRRDRARGARRGRRRARRAGRSCASAASRRRRPTRSASRCSSAATRRSRRCRSSSSTTRRAS